jgi:hypothetical protein
MITIFTTAKPYVGQMKTNQINAIKSWKQLRQDIKILLFGQGEGYAEVARELDLVWVERVATSDSGTSLVNGMFELAKRQGLYSTRMYINCDIVLTGNLSSIFARYDWYSANAMGCFDKDLELERHFGSVIDRLEKIV